HGPDFVGLELLHAVGVPVLCTPAPQTTTFENVYEHGARRQKLHAVAAPLSERVVQADVVFVCPVPDEVAPRALVAAPGGILGAGIQGWMRQREADGLVARKRLGDVAWLEPCHALFCSVEDLGDDGARLVPALCEVAQIVVVTEGAKGARV